MSVDPVHAGTAGIERPTPEPKQHGVSTLRGADSGNISYDNTFKIEICQTSEHPGPTTNPEHEVKVILDTSVNNTLVYQVLEKQSGDAKGP